MGGPLPPLDNPLVGGPLGAGLGACLLGAGVLGAGLGACVLGGGGLDALELPPPELAWESPTPLCEPAEEVTGGREAAGWLARVTLTAGAAETTGAAATWWDGARWDRGGRVARA